MKAVVMAGGEGSRLRPLTLVRPKPMLPVVNRPVLGHILYLLKQHNITDVIMTVQYLASQIQDYYGDGRNFGMNIEYAVEESPLGTAGSVRNAADRLCPDEPLLVISGDALTDFDLTALLAEHKRRGAVLTMALTHVPNPLEYGVINIREDGRVLQFLEKPSWGSVTSDTVNTGIYALEPEVLQRIPPNTRLDWSQDVFPGMLSSGAPLYGHVVEGYWCDIGAIPEYQKANTDLLNGRLHLGDLGQRIGPDIWCGGNVSIDSDVQLFGPIYLGEEVKIKRGVIVQGPSVIRDYTILDDRARVHHSIIWRNCYIGEGATLHGAVIGRQCSLKSRAMVFEGAVVGDGTVVGADAIIQAGVKVWPNKEVENGATVNHSVIWGLQGRRVLFGRYGVTGVINVDLTPDFVARLGAAFGSVLPRGSTVTINRDPHRSPRMIKRALVSGLPSAGNNVVDLRSLPIPVARYYTRAIKAAGGVHVRLSPYDPRVVDIRFMGPDGLNLTRERERAIERLFFREDYRRVYLDDIGNIDYAPDAPDVYATGYMAALDVEAIQNAGFKVVVDYAHAPAAEVLPELLNRLQVDAVPLNARVDATRLTLAQEELRAGRAQLARIVRALDNVSLGIRLDVGGEKLYVADDTGTTAPDRVMAVAMAALVFQSNPGCTVAVTIDQPQVYEQLAEKYGGQVRRTPVDLQALMSAATESDVVMATDGAGDFAFPDLYPGIDGLFAVGKLLELLARQRTTLSQVIADLPPFHVAAGHVDGAWETKGRVMRCLIEQFSKLRHETIDGIKVHLGEREWVLVRPDNDTPQFHLTAEARSLPAAQELVADYGGLVRRYIQEPCSGGEASNGNDERWG
jgi:mannose-1-phosphate guanylyltransferase / phosphomannomutase